MRLNLQQRGRAVEALQRFYSTPLEDLIGAPDDDPAENALRLFQEVAQTVPAYRRFLEEQGVQPETIQSPCAFQSLPLVSKASYLRRYPLSDLCRGGRLEQCDMIAVSSGSTGEPTFWPRFLSDELRIAVRFEQVFRDSFRADEQRTLAVVCFALGTWVGGMYTAGCCRHLAAKGYPLTVITPGNNRAEILRVIRELGPLFDQVVLLGYPPFLKDVIDAGRTQGVEWSRYRIRLVMAGEVFSEEWRELIAERIGSQDLLHDFASLYGTADAGVLGNETPLSIAIRRFLAQRPEIARQLFGESRLPTLVQYDPFSRYFESVEGTLLFTGDNGIPLIRYHISDEGGLIPYDAMLSFLERHGFAAAASPASERLPARPLPFAFVFGRSHFTVSFYGANIYPENVTVGLEQPGIREWVTGKFVLQTQEDARHNRRLFIAVELAPGESASAERERAVAESIENQLMRLNSEFAHYVPPERRAPQVRLLPAGDPDYFPTGVKHRYTRRS
jgi:phenylacetate-CoA ligase